MTEPTQRDVNEYLARLDKALADVQPEVRADIVAGIREELTGLDPASVTARIDELGDPAFIASEAKRGMPTKEPAGPPPSRAFSIAGVLILIIGAFVVPILGPLVGLVWVSFSTAWSRQEKLVAWLIPIGATIVLLSTFAITTMIPQTSPAPTNPVLPFAAVSGGHLAILLPYLVLPIEGIVLFVRANRRGWIRPKLAGSAAV